MECPAHRKLRGIHAERKHLDVSIALEKFAGGARRVMRIAEQQIGGLEIRDRRAKAAELRRRQAVGIFHRC